MNVLKSIEVIGRRSTWFGLALACAALIHPAAAQPASSTPPAGMELLIAEAKKEGTLTCYCTISSDVATPWMKIFSDRYGIEINTYRANTNTIMRKYEQERGAGRATADLFAYADISTWKNALEKGYVATYTPASAEFFKPSETIPGKFYPVYFSSYPIFWNTTKTTKEEQDMLGRDPLSAVLDPRFANGRIGIAVPHTTVNLQGFHYYVLINNPARGWPYLEKLAAQKPKLFDSLSALQSAVVQGEIAVAFAANDGSVSANILKGAPVEFRYPERTVSTGYGMAIASDAPHPYAARLFMEWATSEEAQAKLSELLQLRAGHTKVAPPKKVAAYPWYQPPGNTDMTYSTDPAFQRDVPEILKKWSTMFGYEQ
ncbi:MAG: ABC transporter substrate-binding protein [Xanthobacteraceae bacterium]